MQRRHTSNGNSVTDTSPASKMVAVTTVNGDDTKTLPPMLKRRKKKIRSSAFTAHYGPELEALVQVSLTCGFIVVVTLYAFWKFLHGGWEMPQIKIGFKPRIVYRIPNMMETIGDKSIGYQLLRQEIDEILPEDDDRSLAVAESLRNRTYEPVPIPGGAYDVTNCPPTPPEGYPYAWNLMELLSHWPPDDVTSRPKIHMGLCRFDFKTELEKAIEYRERELPFVVRGDPDVARTVERWNHEGYMMRLMNTVPHRCEYSPNNHFMYWVRPSNAAKATIRSPLRKKTPRGIAHVKKPANWSQPTDMLRMVYKDWLEHANVSDDQLGPDKPHWYYRLIGCGRMGNGACDRGSSEYLFDELTFFQPKPSLYLVNYKDQKGIHCRFGMKGVIAENHFDGSRNSIALLGGERRYILSHPDECENLYLYPKDHPSARHSAVDWSEPTVEDFPRFVQARSNEVVLQPGDVLYLPTNWFHYIISLDLNFQCNTRSGIGTEYMPPITKCGF